MAYVCRSRRGWSAIVAVSTTGVWDLTDQQKKDFVAFVHDDGKGFVGVHAALDANHDGAFPEYQDMIGGEFAAHPWNAFFAPVIIEDREFPAVRHFTSGHVVLYDEMYMPRMNNSSREKVNVLIRLDEAKLGPPVNPSVVGAQVAAAPEGARGRVFYSSLGHTKEAWSNPDVTRMYLEAIKWALGFTEGSTASHPKVTK